MKAAFFEIQKWEEFVIRKKFPKAELLFFKGPLKKTNLSKIKDCDCISVFIYSKLDENILSKLPKLKLICSMSTGLDHIDLDYCKKNKIKVKNVPSYGENTVAEHTIALLLAISRKLIKSINRTHFMGSFETDDSLRGFDLKNKKIGIIGGGKIGQHVARMCKGFQMNVSVFDIKKNDKLAKKIGFKYSSLNNILKNSDIISLHVPYNDHTHHMINDETFNLMKKDVILLNTSRGGLIETKSLIKNLKNGKILAAALDVLEEECEIKEESSILKSEFKKTCDLSTVLANHMLMKMENVLVTPHNAFNSTEAMDRILNTTIENIKKTKL